VENLATRLRSSSRWSADLNLDDRDLVRAHSHISVDATVRTVRHPVRKSQAGVADDAQGRTVGPPGSNERQLALYSFLKATAGSRCAARRAGSTPATAPSAVAKPIARMVRLGVMRNNPDWPGGVDALATMVINAPRP
jgi:hypothetical protein